MTRYEALSIRMANWLTQAGEIEEIVDAIDHAALHAPDVDDGEYEALCRLYEAADLALDGWSRSDAAFAKLTVEQVRSRS
jgi:hypothetical protein